jgi:rubredoxin
MLNPVFLSIFLTGLLTGLVLGYVGTRQVLMAQECPRCGGKQIFEDIRYRCTSCGEVTEEEEL